MSRIYDIGPFRLDSETGVLTKAGVPAALGSRAVAVLERALTQLITAQENRYWVSICDVLEYEIVPILESWQRLVERTREQIN